MVLLEGGSGIGVVFVWVCWVVCWFVVCLVCLVLNCLVVFDLVGESWGSLYFGVEVGR